MTCSASSNRSTRTAGGSYGRPSCVVVGLHPARADAELEPAVAQQVDRRRLLGEDRRVLVVVVEHERADPQRRGVRGRHRDRGQRRELLAEVVGHEQRRVPEVFELARLVAPRRAPSRAARSALRTGTACHDAPTFPRAARRRARTSRSLRSATTMYDICQRSRRCFERRRRCSSSVPTSVGRREHARRRPRRRTSSRSPSSDARRRRRSRARSRAATGSRGRRSRSPAASRTHASFWSVAAGVSDCAVSGDVAVTRAQVRVDADDLRFARRERRGSSGAPPPMRNGRSAAAPASACRRDR